MNEIWTLAGIWMLRTALGGGLLLLVTCLLMRWTRQPVRRQRLGDMGLLAALLTALLCAIGPSWLVIAYSRGERTTGLQPVADSRFQTLNPDWAMAQPRDLHVALVEIPDLPAITPLPASEDLPVESANWIEPAIKVAMLATAAIAAFFTVRLLLGYVGLLRLLVRSESPPPEVRGLFETMAAGTRWVRLVVSRRLLVPLSCGLLRPTVVLPATMCARPTPRQLRWIFAHELTHLRRRDAWSALLFNFGQIFFFALPWFWWLRRQVRLCQEFVADAAAAEQDQGEGEGNVGYAEFLVSLANAPAVPVGASAVSGNCSDLFRRVAMLLKNPMRVETRCPRLWNFLVAISLAGLAVLVSGFGYRAEAAEDDQIIIIINSQGAAAKGQAEKPHEIRIIMDGKESGNSYPDGVVFKILKDASKADSAKEGGPGRVQSRPPPRGVRDHQDSHLQSRRPADAAARRLETPRSGKKGR